MFEIKGELGEAIAVGDGWIEKLRAGQSVTRIPASRYEGLDTRRYSKRKFVVFGSKTEHLTVTVNAGTFLSLQLPAGREAEVPQLQDELERAKAAAG